MKFIQKNPLIVLLIIVFLTIVIGAAGYFLLIGPKKATIDNKDKEVQAIQQDIKTEQDTNKKLLETKNKATEYEAKLAELDTIIPQEPQLPQLIRNLQAAADPGTGAGLPWVSFSPSDISEVGGGAGYSTYDFSMTVTGYYQEVNELVYNIERFPRAVLIETINITTTTSIIGWNETWADAYHSPPNDNATSRQVVKNLTGDTSRFDAFINANKVITENNGFVQAEITAKTFTYAPASVGGWTESQGAAPAAQPQTEEGSGEEPAVQ